MHEGQLVERHTVVMPEKLSVDKAVDRALMVVTRMRSAWSLDSRTEEGYARLALLREEVNYLTAEQIVTSTVLPSTELPLSAFPYDETDVKHRVSHPDRPGDDLDSLDPALVAEVVSLLDASPDAIKQLASMDILLTEQ